MTLQPEWRKVSTNPAVRCENGDPFPLLVDRLVDMIQNGAESLLNAALVDPLNDLLENLPWPLSYIGRPIPRPCWNTQYDPVRCSGGSITPEQQLAHARCEDTSYGLENLCYYARVRSFHESKHVLGLTHANCVPTGQTHLLQRLHAAGILRAVCQWV